MHPALVRSNRFQDLLDLDPAEHDAPYVFESIFRRDGWFARRLSKQKYKLLKRLDPRLRTMLEEGERVRFLTFGSRLAFWESYFLGVLGQLINRRAIALTDRRILLLQVDWRNRPRDMLAQIRYPSIDHIRRTFFGNLRFRLNDGRKHAFQGVPRSDRKLLHQLSDRMKTMVGSDAGGLEDLCPHCFGVVDGRPPRCALCGGPFKSPRTAALRSLLFPGLGDFYLGHWKFAIWETLFAAIMWVSLLMPSGKIPPTPAQYAIIAAMIVLLVHVPDALATRYLARKGLYPAGGSIGARVSLRRRAQARAAAGVASTA